MNTIIKKLPYNFAKTHGLVAIKTGAESYTIYYRLPLSLPVITELQRFLGLSLQFIQADEKEYQHHLAACYQTQSTVLEAAGNMQDNLDLSLLANQLPNSEDLLDNKDDAPIISLLNAIFTQAIKQQASDIHIETYEEWVLVRYRIDGVLHEILEIKRAAAPLVISRIKVMAKLDIAEKRIPQDGRIALRIGEHTIDVRVSTLPSNHGERIVLRILDKQAAELNLSSLGMPPTTLDILKKLIAQPHGIILVTGPTGSGKTTSLYAMLTELNEVTRNILTIEDPVEFDLPGIGQTQVNTKTQLTFAKGLRAILRQDPDVVMIGEIRDLETAEIAVQASLTGHLVLSTLHTNSALGAISRLKDMGVESFLLSSSLLGLMAQRLVRKLCVHCKKTRAVNKEEKIIMNLQGKTKYTLAEAQGCNECNHTGYKGRTGIYELIPIDDALRGMIHREDSLLTIEASLRPHIPTIRDAGFTKVLAGETSLAEILRVTSAY